MRIPVGQQKIVPGKAPAFQRFQQMGRAPLLVAAILALLAAIWGGWVRMGWQFPVLQPSLIGGHGPLMVSGFFGTLISLERAVAMRRRWPYIGPILSGLGGILLILGIAGALPALLLTLGSLGLVAIFGAILRQDRARYLLVMAAGALAWAVGDILWLASWPIYRVVLWWAAFLILTIAGERLELGRLVRHPPRVERLFTAATALFVAGLVISLFFPSPGVRLASLGLLGLAAWLLRYDIARRTVRQTGLPRFAAVSLLSGYTWLVVAGLLGLRFGAVPAGFHYDAFLHSIFLGFTFAMIFAHAPIIFPAILGIPIVFHRNAYLPLILLHLSLVLRVAGDLLLHSGLRLWGGMLNGITILIFLGLTVRSIRSGYLQSRKQRPVAAALSEEENQRAIVRQALWLQRLWIGSLAAFIFAGLTGTLMRWWMWQGFPAGVNFENVRHAHSHLMYFAWVTPALMALIAARLPTLTGRLGPHGLFRTAAAALIFGLLSYPSFFLWGYNPVAIGSLHLPVAVIFSSLNLFAWYGFAFSYRQAVAGIRPTRPVKLWNAALAFLMAASLGAWLRAVLAMLNVEDAFLAAAAVHLFLDLFSSGWAVLGILGLAYAAQPYLVKSVSGWEDPLLLLGLPLSFLLGIPVDLVPVDLRTLAGIGGLMAAAGLLLHIRKLWSAARARSWSVWRLPLAFLFMKAGMDAAGAFPALARFGEQAGLRILYLHVLLLGFVTLGLLAAAADLAPVARRPDLRWVAWAVVTLLLPLLPLTGLWPAGLGGDWRLALAFVLSIGPAIFASSLLVREVGQEKKMYNSMREGASTERRTSRVSSQGGVGP